MAKKDENRSVFVVYENGKEVIVGTKKSEKLLIREFFKEGKRNLEDYDRSEKTDSGIQVTSSLKSWYGNE